MRHVNENEIDDLRDAIRKKSRQELVERHADLWKCIEAFGRGSEISDGSCSAEREVFYKSLYDFLESNGQAKDAEINQLERLNPGNFAKWLDDICRKPSP